MAVYRLHRKEWEKGSIKLRQDGGTTKKRKRKGTVESSNAEKDGDEEDEHPVKRSKFAGGRGKGVLSSHSRPGGSKKKSKWWTELLRPELAKESMSLKAG
jgi:hypothetical protein